MITKKRTMLFITLSICSSRWRSVRTAGKRHIQGRKRKGMAYVGAGRDNMIPFPITRIYGI